MEKSSPLVWEIINHIPAREIVISCDREHCKVLWTVIGDTVFSAHCIVIIAQCTQHCDLCTVNSAHWTAQYSVHSVQWTVHTAHWTAHCAHFIVTSLQRTVHGALHSAQCTVHSWLLYSCSDPAGPRGPQSKMRLLLTPRYSMRGRQTNDTSDKLVTGGLIWGVLVKFQTIYETSLLLRLQAQTLPDATPPIGKYTSSLKGP